MENVKMSETHFVKLAKELLKDIEKGYSDCFEPKVLDDSEDNICSRCNGFLYICQGGVPDVDCPSCNGTGQNTENVFNDEKFIEFMEHTIMFGKEPFFDLMNCEIDNTLTEIIYPKITEPTDEDLF